MDASVYKRPEKPRQIYVTPIAERRPQVTDFTLVKIAKPLVVDGSTECHVTPADVAARMVEYIGLSNCSSLLEPQGGTGNLVHAALEGGWSDITVIERHYTLVDFMRSRFESGKLHLMHSCFLEYSASGERKFAAILTNPPFKKVYAHIRASISLLKRNGVLVALVPQSFEMDGFIEMESLPSDTFENAKVLTKIVRYVHC